MDQRGRKSLDNLALVTPIPGQRLEPPGCLSADEAEVWRAVVSTKPGGWFDAGTLPLLADYCTACVQQERVRADLNSDKCEMDKAIRQLDLLGKLKMALATKMRLTNQSRYTPQAANTASKNITPTKPWERATG